MFQMFQRKHPLVTILVKLGAHIAGHVLKKQFADKLMAKVAPMDSDAAKRSGVRVRPPSTS